MELEGQARACGSSLKGVVVACPGRASVMKMAVTCAGSF